MSYVNEEFSSQDFQEAFFLRFPILYQGDGTRSGVIAAFFRKIPMGNRARDECSFANRPEGHAWPKKSEKNAANSSESI